MLGNFSSAVRQALLESVLIARMACNPRLEEDVVFRRLLQEPAVDDAIRAVAIHLGTHSSEIVFRDGADSEMLPFSPCLGRALEDARIWSHGQVEPLCLFVSLLVQPSRLVSRAAGEAGLPASELGRRELAQQIVRQAPWLSPDALWGNLVTQGPPPVTGALALSRGALQPRDLVGWTLDTASVRLLETNVLEFSISDATRAHTVSTAEFARVIAHVYGTEHRASKIRSTGTYRDALVIEFEGGFLSVQPADIDLQVGRQTPTTPVGAVPHSLWRRADAVDRIELIRLRPGGRAD